MKSIFKTSVQSEDGIGEIDVSRSFIYTTNDDHVIILYNDTSVYEKGNLQKFVYQTKQVMEEDMSRLQSFRSFWNTIHAPK